MNRLTLEKAIERRAWTKKLLFGGAGPYFEVRGLVDGGPFCVIDKIPVRLEDNHDDFWQKLLMYINCCCNRKIDLGNAV